jgi:predicted nuclease of predicted toxin-antitoxin system
VEVKLRLDENISPKVGEMLRDQDGLDAVHVRERGLLQAADRDVLERAYAEDRVLVTKNVEDFVKLARARDLHPGIVLLEDGDLVRDEQLRVVRAAVALLGPERDLVNRVLRVWADGRHVFEDGDEVRAAHIGS